MSELDPLTLLAFDRMLGELYEASLKKEKSRSHVLGDPRENAAQVVFGVLGSLNWDWDKYLGDENYDALTARWKDDTSKMRLIAFMKEHLGPTPTAGIRGLAALLERLQIKDAAGVLSRIPEIAR